MRISIDETRHVHRLAKGSSAPPGCIVANVKAKGLCDERAYLCLSWSRHKLCYYPLKFADHAHKPDPFAVFDSIPSPFTFTFEKNPFLALPHARRRTRKEWDKLYAALLFDTHNLRPMIPPGTSKKARIIIATSYSNWLDRLIPFVADAIPACRKRGDTELVELFEQLHSDCTFYQFIARKEMTEEGMEKPAQIRSSEEETRARIGQGVQFEEEMPDWEDTELGKLAETLQGWTSMDELLAGLDTLRLEEEKELR